jgi:transcription-repair coupling factor (superfamily II helicase)
MRLADWVLDVGRLEGTHELLANTGNVAWHAVAAEARPFLLASIYRTQPCQTLIVAANYERCLAWQAKLALCGVPESDIFQLPSGTSALFEDASPEFVALSDRIGALQALISNRPGIIIGAASAVLERTLPRDILAEAFISVRPKDSVDSDHFLKQLAMLGYQNQEPVRLPGQFSRRGGIIDVWVSGYDLPIRVELFGDEVESMRTFDPMSQRSVGIVTALGLSPSRETLFPLDGGENWGSEVANLVVETMNREASMLADEASSRLEELVTADARALIDHVYFDRLDLYRPFLHPDSGCAIDLLGEDGWLVIDEPLEIESIATRSEEELAQSLDARHRRGEILHATAGDYMLPPEHLANHRNTLAMSAMNALPDWLPLPTVDVGAVSLAPYRGLG